MPNILPRDITNTAPVDPMVELDQQYQQPLQAVDIPKAKPVVSDTKPTPTTPPKLTTPPKQSPEPPVAREGNLFSIEDYDFAFKNEGDFKEEDLAFMREEVKSHNFSSDDFKYAKDNMNLDRSFMMEKQAELSPTKDDDIMIEVTADPSKIVNYMTPFAKRAYEDNRIVTGNDDIGYKHINALHYSKVLNRPIDEIYADYDNIKLAYHAADVDDESAFNQIKEVWNPSESGGIGVVYNKTKGNWNRASEQENFMEDLYPKILAGEDVSGHIGKYKKMLTKPTINLGGDSSFGDSFYGAVGMGSGIVGSWWAGAKGAAIGGAGGLALGAATGPGALATGATGAARGFTTANFAYWSSQGTSKMMLDMMESGIPQELARKIAVPMGLVYAGIEKIGALDKIPILKGQSKDFGANGVLGFLKIKLMNYLTSVSKESSEEGLQKGIEEFAQRIGYELSPEDIKGGIKDIPTLKSTAEDMVKSTIESVPSIMWLGGGKALTEKVNILPETQAEKDTRNAKHKKNVEGHMVEIEKDMVNDVKVVDAEGKEVDNEVVGLKKMMHSWLNKHKVDTEDEFMGNLQVLSFQSGLKDVETMTRTELFAELELEKKPVVLTGTLKNMVNENRKKLIMPKKNLNNLKKALALELDPVDLISKDEAVSAIEEHIQIINEKVDREEELTEADKQLLEIEKEENIGGVYSDNIINRVVEWSQSNVIDEISESKEHAAEIKQRVEKEPIVRQFVDYMADVTGRTIVSTGKKAFMADMVQEGHLTTEEAIQRVKESGMDMDQFDVFATDEEILAQVVVKGYNDGVTSYVMKTGDITTPIEESAEEWYKEASSDTENGEVFVNMVRNNRRAYEKSTGDKTNQSDIEWFSDRVVDYAINDKPFWEGADSRIKGIMNALKELSKMILERAATTMDMIGKGTLSSSFEKTLQEAYAPFVGTKKQESVSEKQEFAKKVSEVIEVPAEEVKVAKSIFKVIESEVKSLADKVISLEKEIASLDERFKNANTKVKKRNARVRKQKKEKELAQIQEDIAVFDSIKNDEIAAIKFARASIRIRQAMALEEEAAKVKSIAESKEMTEGKQKTYSKYEFSLNKIIERSKAVSDEINSLKEQLQVAVIQKNKGGAKAGLFEESMARIENLLSEKEAEFDKIENAIEEEMGNVEQLVSQDTHRRGRKRRAKIQKENAKGSNDMTVLTFQLSVANEDNWTDNEKKLLEKMDKPKKGQRYTSKENAMARARLKRINNLASALIKHKDDVVAKSKELRKYAVTWLEPSERGVLVKGLIDIIDGKLHATTRDVDAIFNEARQNIKDAVDKKELKDLQNIFSKETKKVPKPRGAKPKGRKIAADPQSELTEIIKISEMSVAQLNKAVDVALSLSDFDEKGSIAREDAEVEADRKLVLYNTFGSYKNMDSAALTTAIGDIRSLIETGEQQYLVAETKKKERVAELIETFKDDITDGKGLLSQTKLNEYILNNSERKDQLANKVLLNLQNIATISDIMSNKRTDNMLEGAITKYLTTKMQKMDNEYHKNLSVEYGKIQKIYKRYFGDDQDTLENMEEVREDTGVMILNEKTGEEEELVLSYADAITLHMLEMNDKGSKSLKQAGFTATTHRQLEEFMGTAEQYLPSKRSMEQFAGELLNYYNEYYDRVNAVYKKTYNINLPKEEFYSPLRIFTQSDIEHSKLLKEGGARASLLTSAMATRTDHKLQARTNNVSAFKILTHHVTGMENFIAKAEGMKEIRSIMQSKDIKQAITQEVGEDVNVALANAFDRYEVGPLTSLYKVQPLDKLLSNYARAKIALKVGSTTKQLSSNIAYAINMPVKEFVKGMANFMANPQLWSERMEELMQSEFMKERYSKGVDPTMRAALEGTGTSEQEALLKPTFNKKLSDVMMVFIKLGDAAAIISGGWALYDYKKKQYRSEGMSEEESKAEALVDFENATALMQQSGKSKDVGAFQESGNSMLRLFTMFQNSQFAYWRMVQSGYRNLSKGRGSKAQNLKALFVAGVVLPASFASMSFVNKASWALMTGNLDDPDEEEAMRRAILSIMTSPFSTVPLPIVGDSAEAIANAIFGNHVPWAGQLPVFGEMYRFGKAGTAVYNADFLSFVKEAKSVAGSISGMPFDQIWKLGEELLEASDK